MIIPQQQKWMFYAIYASPHAHNCTILCENWHCIYDHYKCPWLLAGNFNEILSSSEKFGGRVINLNRSNQFLNCLNYCNLIDLGFKGSRYTWTNNHKCGSTILERLDRCLANFDWNVLFPNSLVTHLPRTHSDHCPLLLNLLGKPSPSTKPFRFETIWTSHPDLRPMIKNIWQQHLHLLPSIKCFQHTTSYWNRYTFGNIFKRKQKLLVADRKSVV